MKPYIKHIILFILLMITVHYIFAVYVILFLPRIPFSPTFPPVGKQYIWPPYTAGRPNAELSIISLWQGRGWDSINYLGIAMQGYDMLPFTTATVHNWAYFPVFPVLSRVGSIVFFFVNSADSILYAGFLLSILAFTAALVLLQKLTQHLKIPKNDYYAIVTAILVFPTSYFFHLFYPESLYFLLSIVFFYLLFMRKYELAACSVAIAIITRINGLALIPAFIAFYIVKEKSEKDIFAILASCGSYIGIMLFPLFLFCLYLYQITGDFFAAFKIQAAWHNTFFPFGYFVSYLNDFGFTLQLHHIGNLLLILAILGMLLWVAIKNKNIFSGSLMAEFVSLFTYACAYWIILASVSNLNSIFRYAGANIAFFILPVIARRNVFQKPVFIGMIIISTLLQALFFTLFLTQVPAYGF